MLLQLFPTWATGDLAAEISLQSSETFLLAPDLRLLSALSGFSLHLRNHQHYDLLPPFEHCLKAGHSLYI